MFNKYYRFFKKIGFCIKDKSLKVEEQNDICKEFCGDQIGKVCDKGCTHKLKSEVISDKNFSSKINVYKNMHVDKSSVDSIIIQDEENVITLLIPIEAEISRQIEILNHYNLSKSEKNIIKKFLQGKSNHEIAAELFISKSTLRTHLNNIYKKIPKKLKDDILSWHFRSGK